MPVHDWQKVGAGIFHDFHIAWIAELRKALNTGILPPDYYGLIKKAAADVASDGRTEDEIYACKRKTLAIHYSDHIIAMIEILSPGTKASSVEFRRFLDNAVGALNRNIHLLVVDLFPPSQQDRQGIHGAIFADYQSELYEAPVEKPFTLVSYVVDLEKTAYLEPVAVGDVLPDMPLFLDRDTYVPVPLEATYQLAYRGVPQRWRKVLEG